MRILGAALSCWGIPFISAKASHGPKGSTGEVACETQCQCDAIAARAATDGWSITVRVATAEEIAEWKRWQ